MYIPEQGLKIFHGWFVTVIAVNKNQVHRWKLAYHIMQQVVKVADTKPDVVQFQFLKVLLCNCCHGRISFDRSDPCICIGCSHAGGGDAQRCAQFQDIFRLIMFHQAV